jgi:MoxR-like ATPase
MDAVPDGPHEESTIPQAGLRLLRLGLYQFETAEILDLRGLPPARGAPDNVAMGLPGVNRWTALLAALEQGLLERETAARVLLLAALAGEHVLLIGPPGTAKSELARRLHRVIGSAGYFERLLTRFSTPEELFGPLSLKSLEDDRYERLTTGFLPTAGIAFLDEVFKANSAILNALLTLLNEREFDNGSGRVKTPLVSVVGASNELPTDESLQAFFDRFLLRVPVAPVGDASFAALLSLGDAPPAAVTPLAQSEREAVEAKASSVALGDELIEGCRRLRTWLAARGQTMSDRRWRQWMALMRVAAASEGRTQLDALDLWLAPFVAAAAPKEMAALEAWFAGELIGAVAHDAPWLARAVEAFEQQLQIETSAQDDPDAANAAGKLALARSIGIGGAGAGDEPGMLRIVSSALEEQMRRRYSRAHINARMAQIDEVIAQLDNNQLRVRGERDALAQRLAGRVWLPPRLAARLVDAHDATLAMLAERRARLATARDGFAALPLDPQLPAVAPAPVVTEALA